MALAQSRFDDSAKEEIRSRTDIASVIGRYVNLKPSGQNLKGLCPFHKEKSPSFFVNPARGSFYCFGCGKGGDVFGFLMELEGLSFPEALKSLADETGVRLERSSFREQRTSSGSSFPTKTEMLRIHDVAARFYYSQIKAHPKAIDYFKSRGLKGETARDFMLGYAPPGWSNFITFAKKQGISDEALLACGLAITKAEGGQPYDRFRDRIMFTLFDLSGRPIALAGRALTDEQMPKYLNSPETPLYHKSHVLYGLDKSRTHIKNSGFAIIVEGYMDYLALYQSGVRNVVATCGTALTPEHCALLGRFTSRVVLIFDGDSAGKSAAERGIFTLAPSGLDLHVLILPDEEDPDSYIKKHGVDRFNTLLAGAQNGWKFIIDTTVQSVGSSPHGKSVAIARLAPLIGAMRDTIIRSEFVKMLSERTDVAESVIRSKLERPIDEHGNREDSSAMTQDYLMTHEGNFIRLLVQYPQLIGLAQDRLSPDVFSDRLSAELYSTLLQHVSKGNPIGALAGAVTNPEMVRIFALLSVKEPPQGEDPQRELYHTMHRLEVKSLKNQLRFVRMQMKEQPEKTDALLKEHLRITTRLREMSSAS